MISLFNSFFSSIVSFFDPFYPVATRFLGALLSSLSLSFLLGNPFLWGAKRLFRSQSRQWTPETHQAKNDTPTMGGVFIIAMAAISSLLWCNLMALQVVIVLACIGLFGLIGGWDDWGKITKKGGISARTKFIAQVISATLITLISLYFGVFSTEIVLPFFKNVHFDSGLFYIPYALFIIIGTSNAVNLTDGLDGLAAGSLIPAFLFFGITAAFKSGGTAELAIVVAALIGSLLGFLRYNAYPAQLFMGDVGSLSLGAVLAFMALATKQELLLPLVGIIFVSETVSVILQVWSVKSRGKRLFKMAPIHHHFELLGWPETKITWYFSLVSFVAAALALFFIVIA